MRFAITLFYVSIGLAVAAVVTFVPSMILALAFRKAA